jgi:glycosyltransferase involved in cell wall biosynthesis
MVGPFPPTTGGVTTFMLRLIASPLNRMFEFVPFTTSRPPKKATLDNWGYAAMFRGGIVRVFQGVTITAYHVFLFPLVLLFQRIDIVQIQASDFQAFWEAAAYVYWARFLGKPVILRIGGAFDIFLATSPPFVRRMIKAVLCRPNWVIAQSGLQQQFILEAGCDRPILILSNWAADEDVEDVERGETAHPVFLFIAGSDAKRKGYEEVLAAARLLAERNSPARFHLVAVPPVLEARLREAGLTNIEKIDGFVPHAGVVEALRHADVFLLPSHGEGFPNSLIEAMSCGLPSIACSVGAVPEIAADGGVVLIPPGDSVKLADEIARLADDAALRKKLSGEALRTVRARYVAAGVLPKLAALYDTLLPPSAQARSNMESAA